MSETFRINQQQYWDIQHKEREKEFLALVQEPNELAKQAIKYIKHSGTILEIGIANGRDARFFARENNNFIIGVDISVEAIRQLIAAAVLDKTIDHIRPIIADANEIPLLLEDQENYDAFYTRSALHLDDTHLMKFLQYVISHLNC